jgi:hypothetical protein
MLVDAFERKRGILVTSQLTAARVREQSTLIKVDRKAMRQETLLPTLSSSRRVFYSTEGGSTNTKVSLTRTIG